MISPTPTNNVSPAIITVDRPRRSKRQADATIGTRRSQRAFKRRHAGNDTRVYGEDYGFICGYPVGPGGELYGGSMFHPSAATDTPQGRAIQKINEVWGQDKHRGWDNYKNIGIPVCKKKYRPFEFRVKKKNKLGGVEVSVVRMFGCACHSNIRKSIIERHGERSGWEPFGQWSLSKAKAAARRETQRLNAELNNSSTCLSVSSSTSSSSSSSSGYSSSSSEESSNNNNPSSLCLIDETKQQQPWHALCANGSCNWKIRGKYDDISSEIEEERLNKS